MTSKVTINDIRVFRVSGAGSGGDYFQQGSGHWLIDSVIANPMSGYPQYKASRTSWGVNVLGSIVVEIEASDGTTGIATGFGGEPAGWLIRNHFDRFLRGADPHRINMLWDQMYRASLPYGRKGLTVAAISVVDLALWDLLGKLLDEPVYNLIGGKVHDEISLYCTGPRPEAMKELGFWGAKVPLPHGPASGESGFAENIAFLAAHREAVGPGFPLMVDCYMALDAGYAIRLAEACKPLNIYWWEEVLSPDDVEGYVQIRQAQPGLRWTTGEHEYTRYGFRRLIEGRMIDVLQPDVMWVGGLTELLRIAAHASAYDIPVIPHGSGPYSYHFVASQPGLGQCEYVAASADGRSIRPVFGELFDGEPLPDNGRVGIPERPGFGMTLSSRTELQAL